MRLYKENPKSTWELRNRTDGKVFKTTTVGEVFDEAIVKSAYDCADPGLQFSGTINKHNTCPKNGQIRASNPCVTGDTLISTDLGDFPIADLVGKTINVYGGDANLHTVTQVFETGEKEIYELALYGSRKLKLTADHRVLTRNRGDVPANELQHGDAIFILNKDFQGKGYLAVGFFKSLTFLGVEKVYDLTEPATNHFFANKICVHNCSEYLFLDDTACNLLSINLLKFLRNEFNSYQHVVRLSTITLDISVDMSCFPTKKIAEGSYDYRTLGLGYANLGAAIMYEGLAYDSDAAVKLCENFTELMFRTALETSIEMGKALGNFPHFEANKADCQRVMGMKAPDIEITHLRNAQLTLLAPTGTIAFIMDCSTTGIEPHYQLTMTKDLSGGGTMTVESQVLRPALRNLGDSEAE